MSRRRISLLWSLVCLLTVAHTVSATGQPEVTDAAEVQPVRFVVPGDEKPDTPVVVDAINDALAADGVDVALDMMHIPWDVWQQRVNLMFTTGTEFEIIHTMDNNFPSTSYMLGKNAILPLDDLLDEYGSNLRRLIPDYAWEQATVNGSIYAVPAMWIELAGATGWISVRKDLLDEVGLPVPDSLDSILDAAITIQESTDDDFYLSPWSLGQNQGWFLRALSTYPFVVKQSEEIVQIEQDGTVRSYLESEEFETLAKWFNRAYEADVIHPDILSLSPEESGSLTWSGQWSFFLDRGFSLAPYFAGQVEGMDLVSFRLNPEVPQLRENAYVNCNTISSTSPNPEAGVKFLDWLHSSADAMNLLYLGMEGTHWTAVGDRLFADTESNPNGERYRSANWMIGNMDLLRLPETSTEGSIQYEYTVDDSAIPFVGIGFTFDAEPVRVQFANVLAEIQASIYPIKNGVLDYDQHFPEALEKVKAAGLDDVVAEYQRQFAEYLENL